MTAPKFCGIVHKSTDGVLVHLPLEEVHVQALIVDVSAKVTLTQVFANESLEHSPRAKYVFPVPAQAAVCAFEMRTEDGHVITGVAKEKTKAAEEHKQAIRQGRLTGLVEWGTDDVFSISLGLIPSGQKLTTKLTYAMDLMNDDLTDQVRFQLPMCVGERYGWLPDTMVDASAPPPRTKVRIIINIQTKGAIQSVVSPTHPSLTAVPYRAEGLSSPHRMVASYESPEYLRQDFVVTIQAEGLDEPRCFAERDIKNGSIAMQLTLVPKFDLAPIASQEYIFLVDRSGSMGGSRIETAKRTLVMLLRSLPAQGTTFNIFSFGSHCSKMFPSSLEYTQSTLTSATSHVDTMDADFGGTEIRSALELVFKSRSKSSPTAVFVLTDGEAYDIDHTIKAVSDAVTRSAARAPLRVFTLGIGETTSTAMCEGIARAGNGVCLMATTSENILGKCAKLVRASRTFILKNITIDWGIPAEKPGKSSFLQSTTTESIVLQAPSQIESLYPGVRCVVAAIIKDERFVVPSQIVLRGQRDGRGEAIEVRIPVLQVESTDEEASIPLINTLAARRLIMELEDPKHSSKHSEEQKKATIIRFGEQYQLASRYTSFVAIGEKLSEYRKVSEKEKKASEERKPASPFSSLVGSFFGTSQKDSAGGNDSTSLPDLDAPFDPLTEGSSDVEYKEEVEEDEDEDFSLDFGLLASAAPGGYGMGSYGSAAPRTASFSSAIPRTAMFGGGQRMKAAAASFRPSVSPPTSGSRYLPPPTLSAPITVHSYPIAPGSQAGAVSEAAYAPTVDRTIALPTNVIGTPPPPPVPTGLGMAMQGTPPPPRGGGVRMRKSYSASSHAEDPVVRLVRLQSFDGSFVLNEGFIQIVGREAAEKGKSLGVNDTIWATALAVAYFRKHLANQPELLDGLVEKAMDFVSSSPHAAGIDFKALVETAKGFVN